MFSWLKLGSSSGALGQRRQLCRKIRILTLPRRMWKRMCTLAEDHLCKHWEHWNLPGGAQGTPAHPQLPAAAQQLPTPSVGSRAVGAEGSASRKDTHGLSSPVGLTPAWVAQQGELGAGPSSTDFRMSLVPSPIRTPPPQAEALGEGSIRHRLHLGLQPPARAVAAHLSGKPASTRGRGSRKRSKIEGRCGWRPQGR